MEKHPCAVPVCEREVPYHILMCRPHWNLVPREMQARVYATWRAYDKLSGHEPLESIQHAMSAYRTARREAVGAVEEAQGRA